MVIFIDPWKDINFSEPFDLPENVFVVKNSNIVMPQNCPEEQSDNPFCMYSSDKISSIYILP